MLNVVIEGITPTDPLDHEASNFVNVSSEVASRGEKITRAAEREAEAKSNGHAFVPVHIGVGINTGLVMVGAVGASKDVPDVMGGAVNLASRIEGLTKQYGLSNLIAESTASGIEITKLMSNAKIASSTLMGNAFARRSVTGSRRAPPPSPAVRPARTRRSSYVRLVWTPRRSPR